MLNDIETAVTHAIEKQHLQTGDKVDAKTAMHMMDDVRKEFEANHKLYTGNKDAKASVAEMHLASREMSKELAKFGIADIEFFDSGKDGKANGKVDKFDTVVVTESTSYFSALNKSTSFHAGERPAANPTHVNHEKSAPTWGSQVKHYNEDPRTMKQDGYSN